LARRGAQAAIAALIPPDWRLEPADPNWEGHRFVSPRGDAKLELYGRLAGEEPREEHVKTVICGEGVKTVIFGEGEELTYLRGERDWIAVSGFKGDRIFYRKATLSCGGRQWRHIAFEYPAAAKRVFDRLVTAMSRALDRVAGQNCEATIRHE